MKNIVQISIPTDCEYTIVETFYNSLEENAQCCDNCGRIISNIAIIENESKIRYSVGLDCAVTLAGIKDSFDFEYVHKARFAQAKQARATILKMIKKGCSTVTVKTFEDTNNFYKEVGSGKWSTDGSDCRLHSNWKQYPSITWNKYVLPMITDLIK